MPKLKKKAIKDIKNLFKLIKKPNYNAIKDIRNLLDQKNKLKQLKIENLEILKIFLNNFQFQLIFKFFGLNFQDNNYIENESNIDRNKTLLVEEYSSKIRPYLKNIINNLKKSDTWKFNSQQQITLVLAKIMTKSM